MRKFVLAVGILVLTRAFASAWGQMTVHHIDVAQGDATLIEFQTAAILIDVGGSKKGEVRDHLIEYLDDFFERRTDLKKTIYSLIITHPHADHLEWIMHILGRYKVMNLVDGGDRREHGSVAKLKHARALFSKQAKASPLSKFYNRIDAADLGPSGYRVKTFADLKSREPLTDVVFVNGSRICDNPNNDSVVVRVGYGATKILVTGDAEDAEDTKCKPAIPRMVGKFKGGDVLDVDIYKAGHHGSHNGTNLDYLKELTPKITVIFAGFHSDNNAMKYGHPRRAAVEQIIQHTTRSRPPKTVYTLPSKNSNPEPLILQKAVYCTCWDGDIQIFTDAAGNVSSIKTSK